jgi:hypothetical protein
MDISVPEFLVPRKYRVMRALNKVVPWKCTACGAGQENRLQYGIQMSFLRMSFVWKEMHVDG